MARSTIWLERETGTLIVRWLGELTDWTPFAEQEHSGPCLTCARYAPSFDLRDVPHSLLHRIASPIDDLVSGCWATVAAERYDHLLELGWRIALDNGLIAVAAPAIAGGQESAVPASDVAELRLELTELHSQLLARAIYTVQQNQHDIAAAVRATVEPVVRRMAAELIEEVCEP